ncbi:hypothetical protein HDU87_007599 [Geranomyces variabilis]|uniref:Beta-catenin-like protein 1 N-terminal domain-containing protein n=1 Tax=Geranomyces variabilis TaxID=109894 RepID=A0AAD5TGL5_9FUNG|nr:hypothetical protein HDU87_007599 [Geranomyces variabilis]
MDIDAIFKVPTVPASSLTKRKLPASHDEVYMKRLKTTDGDDNEDANVRITWGPGSADSSAKGAAEAEERVGDDEEDERFHGDGLSAEQKEIWDIVDAGEEAPATIELSTLKKMVLKFEKVINKNQDLRVKYADTPLKFIESEADLDEEIKNMVAASAAPEHYATLVDLGTHVSILGLLSHENTDISIATVNLLNELTDEDLVTEASEQAEVGLKALVAALVENDALSLLVQNLNRLNEAQAEDRQGVFNTLSVLENFIGVDPRLSETIVEKTTLLPYLLQRIRPKAFDSNRQYASEMLSVLMQSSRANRLKLGELGGVDALLRVLAAYKRRDPQDADEIELMENLFDTLCAALTEGEIKQLFLDGEGLELMLLMIKEKKMARMRAVKVLSHAMLGRSGGPCCAHFVEIYGLKTLFPLLMRKGAKTYKKTYKSFSESEEDEHVITILASLFRSLSDLNARARLMAKFLEAGFEKVDRLLQMHEQYFAHVQAADRAIAKRKAEREKEDEEDGDEVDEDEKAAREEEDFLDRLAAGLLTLQFVDFVIAFACFDDEEGKIKERVAAHLENSSQSLRTIKTVLKEYAENFKEKPVVAPGEGSNSSAATIQEDADVEYAQLQRDMILGVSDAL